MESWENIALKSVLMVVTAPAWYPFLKAVWEELNESMAEEGGLFGRAPSALELQEIEREKRRRPDPLVHDPWPTAQQRLEGRRTMGGSDKDARKGSGSAPAPPKRNPSQRGGFQ